MSLQSRPRHPSSVAGAADGIHVVADGVLDVGMTGAVVDAEAIVVVRADLAAELDPDTPLTR